MTNRRQGPNRRRSDFWRPLALAVLTALITNAAQAVYQRATVADVVAYYRQYAERCWHGP